MLWNLTESKDFIVQHVKNDLEDNNRKMYFTFWLLILATLFLCRWCLSLESRTWKFLKTIPGPPLLPILGNALEFRNTKTAFKSLEKWPETYGERIRFTVGLFSGLVLMNPNDIEKILNSPTYIRKSQGYKFLEPWLGEGLLTSFGTKWHTRRKLLTPAFHYKILETFNSVFNEQAQVLVEILKGKIRAGEEQIEMYSLFSRCTLDIICETSMGKKLNSQKNVRHRYAVAVNDEAKYLYKRLTSPWLHPDFIFRLSSLGRKEKESRKIVHDFVNEVIQDRKAQIKAQIAQGGNISWENPDESGLLEVKKKSAFLDLMLNLQLSGEAHLTDEDIQDETSTIMLGGHDTNASALTWIIMRLGVNPNIQDKVHAELDQVFGDDQTRPVTSKDLGKLKYLECCIKETFRLHPPLPTIGRKLEYDLQLDENTIVPAGIEVVVSPWLVHRNPKYFPNPKEFDPSRHFPENSASRHPFAFLPFSAGSRNCLGQKFAMTEEKIVLAHLLRNFRFNCVNARSVVAYPEFVLKPKNGVFFQLEAR